MRGRPAIRVSAQRSVKNATGQNRFRHHVRLQMRSVFSRLTLYPIGYNVPMRVQMTEVYRDWINSLKDRAGRARVQVRVDRMVHGNPGQHRVLTDGVCELKVDFGPGYRVYYTERAGVLIVLLAGGDKSSQQQDIKTAISLAKGL
jgi:putative addiction module killer protein